MFSEFFVGHRLLKSFADFINFEIKYFNSEGKHDKQNQFDIHREHFQKSVKIIRGYVHWNFYLYVCEAILFLLKVAVTGKNNHDISQLSFFGTFDQFFFPKWK